MQSCRLGIVRAGSTLEHPGRDLKPAIAEHAIGGAAEMDPVSLAHDAMNADRTPKPCVVPIKHVTKLAPVGVLSSRCTTPYGPTGHSDTSRRPPRSSCQQWPCGRLRNPNRRRADRRPRWRRDRQYTNIPTGPLNGGRSRPLIAATGSQPKSLNHAVGFFASLL